jgi:hypothetical protein
MMTYAVYTHHPGHMADTRHQTREQICAALQQAGADTAQITAGQLAMIDDQGRAGYHVPFAVLSPGMNGQWEGHNRTLTTQGLMERPSRPWTGTNPTSPDYYDDSIQSTAFYSLIHYLTCAGRHSAT